MVRFRFKRKNDVIDLTETLKKRQEKIANLRNNFSNSSEKQTTHQEESPKEFGIFGGFTPTNSQETDNLQTDYSSEEDIERKKRFAKRIRDMSEQIEDLSNQIYHLQQRIEVLERKSGVNNF